MGPGGTPNDMYNLLDGGLLGGYQTGTGYDTGTGFTVKLNLQDGTWNPDFEGTEVDDNLVGMRVGARHTIMHWKRSRGLLYRTDMGSIKVSKVLKWYNQGIINQSDNIHWIDWVTIPNQLTAIGVKIFPQMQEQFGNYPQFVGCMDPAATNYNPQNELEPLNSCAYALPPQACDKIDHEECPTGLIWGLYQDICQCHDASINIPPPDCDKIDHAECSPGQVWGLYQGICQCYDRFKDLNLFIPS